MIARAGGRSDISRDTSRWSAARARNALRHRGVIGAVALLAAVGTLFVLQVLPREAERALDARLAELPPAVDTTRLTTRLAELRAQIVRNDDALVARRARQADDSLFAVTIIDPSGMSALVGDTLRADLADRLRVARASRLLESFRALATARSLAGDARVTRLDDSLAIVSQSLDAFVGISGASDQGYLALRERVGVLGDRLIQLVEDRLQTARDAAGAVGDLAGDSITVALQASGRRLRDSVVVLETAVRRAHEWNAARATREQAWRSAAPLRTPLWAVLAASTVLALALGYLAALLVELRTPRLADAADVTTLVRGAGLPATLVIAHAAGPPVPRRRASDRLLPPVLRLDPAPYQQIHQLLTTMGDAVSRVGIMSAAASDTAAVALNLAAAAADASRAVLLVDGDVVHREVANRAEQTHHSGLAEVAREREELSSAIAVVATGRDRSITMLSAGRTITAREAIERVAPEVQRLMDRFDLTVLAMPQDPNGWPAVLAPQSVVMVVRPGETDVRWLRGALAAAMRDGQRVRAVYVSRAALS